MRLNGSAVNSRALNGVARLPVRAEGDATSILAAELAGQRTRRFSGEQAIVAAGDFLASARRFSSGALGVVIESSLQELVSRSGQGDAVLRFDTALFYTRIAYGFGSSLIDIGLETELGVVYFEGDAVILPYQIEMVGTRRMKAAGDAISMISGELSASAVRRAMSDAALIDIDGESEGSHIHENLLYVGGAGDAAISFGMLDEGMKRQAHIGSLDMALLSEGSGRLIKQTLAGESVKALLLSGDFQTRRMFDADAAVSVLAETEARIFVRGEGETFVLIEAAGNASKITFATGDEMALAVGASCEADKHVQIGGKAEVSVFAEGGGIRGVFISGAAVLALLEESDGYLNIQSLEEDSGVFYRPATTRLFSRSGTTREWRR